MSRARLEHAGARALLRGVERPPSAAQRARLGAQLRAILAWHRTLERWPSVRAAAPDATAFASVYVGGKLRGCFGADEGTTGERVARAMLRALEDTRFGGVPSDQADVVATLSYAHGIRELPIADAETLIEAGVHGLLLVDPGGRGTILLPQVARDGRCGARGLLAALAQKAGVATLAGGRLFTFETFEVSSLPAVAAARSPIAAGAAFLERLVRADGRVDFAMDPRTGATTRIGEMHHGRAAVVTRALYACGRRAAADRARRRLAADIERALRGGAVEGWPANEDVVLGTLALAVTAGIDVAGELATLCARASTTSAWHGAQVVAALGPRAPREVYARCVADLERQPWAPWTAIAAQRMGDAKTARRCADVLCRSVRRAAPYEGGVGFAEVAETALTALVVEALAGASGPEPKRAAASARRFLRAWQLDPRAPRGPVDPACAAGGFPLSPVVDMLRADVTAHALLALRSESA